MFAFAALETVVITARAVSQRDFTQRANISGRNEMAMLGSALNNMSEELAESYAVLEQRVQKTAGLEHKTRFSRFVASQPPTAFTGSAM